MSEITLKPCPFCRGEAEFGPPQVFEGKNYGALSCCSCGATVYSGPCNGLTEGVLAEKWNRRAERTCRDVSERPWQLWCSECGARLDLEDNDGEPTLWNGKGSPLPVSFCPCCGARVVSE